MIKKYKHIALVGTLAIGMAAIGLIYVWSNPMGVGSKMASSNTKASESTKESRGPGSKMLAMDKESRRKRFEESVKHSLRSFASPADTSRAISFKLKSPKSKALGQPSGVYVTKGEVKDDRDAYIYYGDPVDGINITANKFANGINFRAEVGEQEKNKRADILKADNAPFLIEVNGYEGYAWEPGYNIINENKEPTPGSVTWQEDDGVVYTVYGTYGPNGTSAKELLEIARTMSE